MWNSLWSIYDGAATADGNATEHPSTPSKGARDTGGRRNTLVGNRHTPTRKQSSTPSAAQANDNTTILRGIVVGEEKSGKTSLIRRLRGEDPFQHHSNSSKVGADDNGHSNRTTKRPQKSLMALIPWKIPQNITPSSDSVGNELVQLYISEGKSFSYEQSPFQQQWSTILQTSSSQQRGVKGSYDFIIWMIDPCMENVLEFLQDGLAVLFPSSGEDSSSSTKQPLIQHLCILLNFRDIVNNHSKKEDDPLSIDKVQHIVDDQVLKSSTVATSPTILLYESSMKNCFGLQNLHSFITLPYLSYKRRELQHRVEHTRKQQLQWKKGLMQAKAIQYDDFVKQMTVEQKKTKKPTTSKQSLERQKLKEEKERLQRRLEQQNMLLLQRKRQSVEETETITFHDDDRKDEQQKAPSNNTKDDKAQRQLFAKSRKQPPPIQKKAPSPPAITQHTNLESFFSEDDEDEDDNSQSDSESSDSSDSSDDDDFIVDTSGTRVSHATVPRNTGRKRKGAVVTKKKGTAKEKEVDSVVKGEEGKEHDETEDEQTTPHSPKKVEEEKTNEVEENECSNDKPAVDTDEKVEKNGSVLDELSVPSTIDTGDNTSETTDKDQKDVSNENVIGKDENVPDDQSHHKADTSMVDVDRIDIENQTADAAPHNEDSSNTSDSVSGVGEKAEQSDIRDVDKEEDTSTDMQRKLVIDSDDESTGLIEAADDKMSNAGPSIVSLPQQQSINDTADAKAQVSSAALAAIEAAKKEAEQMALQSEAQSNTKREKKGKKKKKKKKKEGG